MKAENAQKYSYLNTFRQAGLSENQALVYEVLLKLGKVPASKIHSSTPLKKGLLYKVLEELAGLGLVVVNEKNGAVTTFEPQHPDNLKKLVEIKNQEARNSLKALDSIWIDLTQDFNLISAKPTVKFYEGMDGAKQITNDSLLAKSEICAFIDSETLHKYAPEYNSEYIKNRSRLKINKKIIAPDSEYIKARKELYNRTGTEVRLIKTPLPFYTVMQIYDDKISYITLEERRIVGMLINNANLSNFHKQIFGTLWQSATPL